MSGEPARDWVIIESRHVPDLLEMLAEVAVRPKAEGWTAEHTRPALAGVARSSREAPGVDETDKPPV